VGAVFVDDASRPDGTPIPRPGETPLNVQWCWGWSESDTVHGGREVILQYKTAGPKRIRVVVLESGTAADQLVISARRYLAKPPDKPPAPKE
jgi:hypothetical protein